MKLPGDLYLVGVNLRTRKMCNSAGTHILLELWQPLYLDDEVEIEKIVRQSIKECGAELLNIYTHKFKPQGVTCVASISESHISIHTWPEYEYAGIDIFTCGNVVDPYKALDFIVNSFKPKFHQIMDIKRGTKL